MAYRKFEDLPVWNAAMDLAARIFDLGDRGIFSGHGSLRDQIERAVLSISNNIAEGYERGTQEELLTFLYYSRGSAGEVCSMLAFLERARAWARLGDEVKSLSALCLGVSKQLGAWIESVKNSDYGGPRRHNDKSRQTEILARRQAAFLEELRRVQEAGGRPPESMSPLPVDPPPG